MLKKLFIASAVILCASASYGQDTHQGHNHEGHDHGSQTQAQAPQSHLPAPDFVFTEAPDDHAIGGDFAPITMISYASVTCGHCGNWFSTIWPKVKAELVETHKIRFVLRELPTAPAPLSMTGFAMAECAPKADYMSVIEYQMENQSKIFDLAKAGKGAQAYADVGKLAGLNNNADITACLQDPSSIGHINLSQRRADAAGVKGVPAFFINGEAYQGDQSAEAFIQLVNAMIATGSSQLPKAPIQANSDKLKIKPAISPIQ